MVGSKRMPSIGYKATYCSWSGVMVSAHSSSIQMEGKEFRKCLMLDAKCTRVWQSRYNTCFARQWSTSCSFFFCLIYLHIHLWRVGDTVSSTRSERQQKVGSYTFIFGTCSSDLCAKFWHKHLPYCDCLSWLFWGVQGKNHAQSSSPCRITDCCLSCLWGSVERCQAGPALHIWCYR